LDGVQEFLFGEGVDVKGDNSDVTKDGRDRDLCHTVACEGDGSELCAGVSEGVSDMVW